MPQARIEASTPPAEVSYNTMMPPLARAGKKR
jgi:hypothetical protein